MPTLFRKIKAGVFDIPDYLNKSVVTLLVHMLLIDPMKRATMEDIKYDFLVSKLLFSIIFSSQRNHEWFKKDLPAYLFPSPTASDGSFIDIDAVNEVCEVRLYFVPKCPKLTLCLQKFSVTDKEVHNALLSGNAHDQLAIAYHLIVDNKRIEDETAKLDLKDLYLASSPPPFCENPKQMAKQRMPSGSITERYRSLSGVSSAAAGVNNNNNNNRATPIKRAKWHLGIRSQSKPHDIMSEVYKAMKLLEFVSILSSRK